MKKLALLIVAAVPSILFVMGADCSGSAVKECPGGDADCTGDENGNTFCSGGVCAPPECAADEDCQLINPDAPTTSEACANDNDCAADGSEVCIELAVNDGSTVCALPAGAEGCGTDVSISAKKKDGGANADVCASANGTCSAGGGCTF